MSAVDDHHANGRSIELTLHRTRSSDADSTTSSSFTSPILAAAHSVCTERGNSEVPLTRNFSLHSDEKSVNDDKTHTSNCFAIPKSSDRLRPSDPRGGVESTHNIPALRSRSDSRRATVGWTSNLKPASPRRNATALPTVGRRKSQAAVSFPLDNPFSPGSDLAILSKPFRPQFFSDDSRRQGSLTSDISQQELELEDPFEAGGGGPLPNNPEGDVVEDRSNRHFLSSVIQEPVSTSSSSPRVQSLQPRERLSETSDDANAVAGTASSRMSEHNRSDSDKNLELALAAEQSSFELATAVVPGVFDGLAGKVEPVNPLTTLRRRRKVRGKTVIRKVDVSTRKKKRCFIRSRSAFRLLWDFCALLFLCYSILEIPINVCFELTLEPWGVEDSTNAVCDIFFMIDFVLNFFTTYVDEDGFIVKIPRLIALHYLRTYFTIDLITSVPISLILEVVQSYSPDLGTSTSFARTSRLLRLLRMARLLRVLRVVATIKSIDWCTDKMQISLTRIFQILKIVFIVFFISHLSSCMFNFIALLQRDSDGMFDQDSWIYRFDPSYTDPSAVSFARLYLLGFYWSLTTIASVGYGDITPRTTAEVAYVCVVVFIGSCVMGYIVGNVSSAIHFDNETERQINDRLRNIDEYMRFRKIPHMLRNRIKQHYEFVWKRVSNFDEHAILTELPSFLRLELALYLYSDLISAVPFLRDLGKECLSMLVTHLKPLRVAPGETIFSVDSLGREMYFVKRGDVEIVGRDGSILGMLNSGAHFGEYAILSDRPTKRLASVRAASFVELYSLSKDSLDEVLAVYPEVFSEIIERAKQQWDQLVNKQKSGRSERSPYSNTSHRPNKSLASVVPKESDSISPKHTDPATNHTLSTPSSVLHEPKASEKQRVHTDNSSSSTQAAPTAVSHDKNRTSTPISELAESSDSDESIADNSHPETKPDSPGTPEVNQQVRVVVHDLVEQAASADVRTPSPAQGNVQPSARARMPSLSRSLSLTSILDDSPVQPLRSKKFNRFSTRNDFSAMGDDDERKQKEAMQSSLSEFAAEFKSLDELKSLRLLGHSSSGSSGRLNAENVFTSFAPSRFSPASSALSPGGMRGHGVSSDALSLDPLGLHSTTAGANGLSAIASCASGGESNAPATSPFIDFQRLLTDALAPVLRNQSTMATRLDSLIQRQEAIEARLSSNPLASAPPPQDASASV